MASGFSGAIFLLRQFVLRQVVPRASRALRHIEHLAYNCLRSGIARTKVRDGERGLSKIIAAQTPAKDRRDQSWMGENR
jgi:hypothetical protein